MKNLMKNLLGLFGRLLSLSLGVLFGLGTFAIQVAFMMKVRIFDSVYLNAPVNVILGVSCMVMSGAIAWFFFGMTFDPKCTASETKKFLLRKQRPKKKKVPHKNNREEIKKTEDTVENLVENLTNRGVIG